MNVASKQIVTLDKNFQKMKKNKKLSAKNSNLMLKLFDSFKPDGNKMELMIPKDSCHESMRTGHI